jgi:hypothetical protein
MLSSTEANHFSWRAVMLEGLSAVSDISPSEGIC